MADMFNLTKEMEVYGQEHGKMGLVYLRDKPGRGGKATSLVVMTEEVFKQFYPVGGK
ncbi:MAG: hypothetical protein KDH96_08895 [Candidatus Riesia sp.]|nr:hypothetical protein [Candidatus Riesia sp.]